MLEIKNLTVSIEGEIILKNINLDVPKGKVVVLFGPNGCGKTTLLMTIMGFKKYNIEEGKILYNGHDLTEMPINERAKLGIGMMFQRPPTVKGVTIRELIDTAVDSHKDIDKLSRILNAEEFIDRYLNDGLSGGEIKRSELLQILSLQPELLLLDEPESGVDVDNVELIGNTINELLHKNIIMDNGKLISEKRHNKRRRSGLVITHTGHILEYINADRGIVFLDGQIECRSNPGEILDIITEKGFEECKTCDERRKNWQTN